MQAAAHPVLRIRLGMVALEGRDVDAAGQARHAAGGKADTGSLEIDPCDPDAVRVVVALRHRPGEGQRPGVRPVAAQLRPALAPEDVEHQLGQGPGLRIAGHRHGRVEGQREGQSRAPAVAPAVARYREALPGVELALRTAPFAEGLRLLENGESDLHCGGIDAGAPLPSFLWREHILDTTAGIVAHEDHPLLAGRPAVRDLVRYPWIDCGGTAAAADRNDPPSLTGVLDALYARTAKRVKTVVRADTVGLFLLATGPWLARLPLNFLDGLPGVPLRPLPLGFGRCR